jgi:hypothetical protein
MIKTGIAIISGCLKRGRNGKWRTSNFDEEGDKFGVVGDRLRVLAAHYLYLENPSQFLLALGGKGQLETVQGVPTIAEVVKGELLELGVPEKKIILEEKSGNTYQNLLAIKNIIIKEDFNRMNVVSNKYHLPRIKAFIENDHSLVDLKEMLRIGRLRLYSAEEVLLKHNPKRWKKIISNAYKSKSLKIRIQKEIVGIKDIREGNYNFKQKTHI